MHSMPQPVSCSRRPCLAEARHAHDALARRRALGETRQRRPDLAADAQNDEIARNFCEVGGERRRRRGHHVFEVIDVAKAIGQGGGSVVVADDIGVLCKAGQANEPRL